MSVSMQICTQTLQVILMAPFSLGKCLGSVSSGYSTPTIRSLHYVNYEGK